MMHRILHTTASIILGVSMITVLASCGSSNRPIVKDYDTYETVRIGPVYYTLPEEVSVVSTGTGYVDHESSKIKDTIIRVEVDTSPPRSLKFDADAERRRFLSEVPGSYTTSVQHVARDNQDNLKLLVRGRDSDGTMLYGAMSVLRSEGNTAVLKIVGPFSERDEINILAERLTPAFTLTQ